MTHLLLYGKRLFFAGQPNNIEEEDSITKAIQINVMKTTHAVADRAGEKEKKGLKLKRAKAVRNYTDTGKSNFLLTL